MGHAVDDDEENYEIHSQEEGEESLTCRICENIFNNPVVTQCGHHFCESCALHFYGQSGNCFICSKPTNGIFNEATKLLAKVRDMKKK